MNKRDTFPLGVDDTSLDSGMGMGEIDEIDDANAKAIDLDTKEEHERGEESMEVALEDTKRYEGDIDLDEEEAQAMINGTKDDIGSSRSAMTSTRRKWPKSGGIVRVPYVISSSYNRAEKANINRAFQEYADKTCIR